MDSISNYYYTGTSGAGTDTIEFVDPSESTSVKFQDFLDLMIAQLQNQDFTNPVSDSEYMTQMAQMSMVQQMQEATRNSQYSFAASLLGRVVTVSDTSSSGTTKTETGYVDSVKVQNNELMISVKGSTYKLSQITEMFDNSYYLAEQYNNGTAAAAE